MYSEHMIEMMEDEIVHKFIEDNNEDDDDFVEEEQEHEEMLQENDLSESTLANKEKKFNYSTWVWRDPNTMSFQVLEDGSDLGLARIEVILHNGSSNSRNSITCGIYTIATRNIRPGFRMIPLLNPENGEIIDNAFIFGRFVYYTSKE